jgi:hypothetical protein
MAFLDFQWLPNSGVKRETCKHWFKLTRLSFLQARRSILEPNQGARHSLECEMTLVIPDSICAGLRTQFEFHKEG